MMMMHRGGVAKKKQPNNQSVSPSIINNNNNNNIVTPTLGAKQTSAAVTPDKASNDVVAAPSQQSTINQYHATLAREWLHHCLRKQPSPTDGTLYKGGLFIWTYLPYKFASISSNSNTTNGDVANSNQMFLSARDAAQQVILAIEAGDGAHSTTTTATITTATSLSVWSNQWLGAHCMLLITSKALRNTKTATSSLQTVHQYLEHQWNTNNNHHPSMAAGALETIFWIRSQLDDESFAIDLVLKIAIHLLSVGKDMAYQRNQQNQQQASTSVYLLYWDTTTITDTATATKHDWWCDMPGIVHSLLNISKKEWDILESTHFPQAQVVLQSTVDLLMADYGFHVGSKLSSYEDVPLFSHILLALQAHASYNNDTRYWRFAEGIADTVLWKQRDEVFTNKDLHIGASQIFLLLSSRDTSPYNAMLWKQRAHTMTSSLLQHHQTQTFAAGGLLEGSGGMIHLLLDIAAGGNSLIPLRQLRHPQEPPSCVEYYLQEVTSELVDDDDDSVLLMEDPLELCARPAPRSISPDHFDDIDPIPPQEKVATVVEYETTELDVVVSDQHVQTVDKVDSASTSIATPSKVTAHKTIRKVSPERTPTTSNIEIVSSKVVDEPTATQSQVQVQFKSSDAVTTHQKSATPARTVSPELSLPTAVSSKVADKPTAAQSPVQVQFKSPDAVTAKRENFQTPPTNKAATPSAKSSSERKRRMSSPISPVLGSLATESNVDLALILLEDCLANSEANEDDKLESLLYLRFLLSNALAGVSDDPKGDNCVYLKSAWVDAVTTLRKREMPENENDSPSLNLLNKDSLGINCLLVSVMIRRARPEKAASLGEQIVQQLRIEYYKLPKFYSCSLVDGKSKILTAIAFLRDALNDPEIASDLVIDVVKDIILQGIETSQRSKSEFMLLWEESDGVAYLGAAHGVTGIIYALLDVLTEAEWKILDGGLPRVKDVVSSTIEALEDYRYKCGSLRPTVDLTIENATKPSWSHGSVGHCLLLLKAAEVFEDDWHLELACDIADKVLWPKHESNDIAPLGLDDGLPGLAYVFLMLSKIDDDTSNEWHEKCQRCSRLAMERAYSDPDAIVEDHVDLHFGVGSIVSLLIDLESSASTIKFPLFSFPLNLSHRLSIKAMVEAEASAQGAPDDAPAEASIDASMNTLVDTFDDALGQSTPVDKPDAAVVKASVDAPRQSTPLNASGDALGQSTRVDTPIKPPLDTPIDIPVDDGLSTIAEELETSLDFSATSQQEQVVDDGNPAIQVAPDKPEVSALTTPVEPSEESNKSTTLSREEALTAYMKKKAEEKKQAELKKANLPARSKSPRRRRSPSKRINGTTPAKEGNTQPSQQSPPSGLSQPDNKAAPTNVAVAGKANSSTPRKEAGHQSLLATPKDTLTEKPVRLSEPENGVTTSQLKKQEVTHNGSFTPGLEGMRKTSSGEGGGRSETASAKTPKSALSRQEQLEKYRRYKNLQQAQTKILADDSSSLPHTPQSSSVNSSASMTPILLSNSPTIQFLNGGVEGEQLPHASLRLNQKSREMANAGQPPNSRLIVSPMMLKKMFHSPISDEILDDDAELTAHRSTFGEIEETTMLSQQFVSECLRYSSDEGSLYLGGIGSTLFLRVRMGEHLERRSCASWKKPLVAAKEAALTALEMAESSDSLQHEEDSFFHGSILSGHRMGVQSMLIAACSLLGEDADAYAYASDLLSHLESDFDFHSRSSCDLVHGYAGALQTMWSIRYYLKEPTFGFEFVVKVAKAILIHGLETAQTTAVNGALSPQSLSPLPNASDPACLKWQRKGRIYLGAAHGAVGILQSLLGLSRLEWDVVEDNLPGARRVVRHTISCLDEFRPDGKSPDSSFLNYKQEKELRDWSTGSAGYCLLLIEASRVFEEPSWLDLAADIAEHGIWAQRMERRNLGLHRGLAGHGYVCMALAGAADGLVTKHYQETDQRALWLSRAKYYAQAAAANWGDLLHVKPSLASTKTQGRPYSLYEGLGGAACFLLDLPHPDEAYFPFYQIPPNRVDTFQSPQKSKQHQKVRTPATASSTPGMKTPASSSAEFQDSAHGNSSAQSWRSKLFDKGYYLSSPKRSHRK